MKQNELLLKMDKEPSSQLLTDSEIMVARVNPSKYIREEWKLKYPISSSDEIAIAQAQLNKVLRIHLILTSQMVKIGGGSHTTAGTPMYPF